MAHRKHNHGREGISGAYPPHRAVKDAPTMATHSTHRLPAVQVEDPQFPCAGGCGMSRLGHTNRASWPDVPGQDRSQYCYTCWHELVDEAIVQKTDISKTRQTWRLPEGVKVYG